MVPIKTHSPTLSVGTHSPLLHSPHDMPLEPFFLSPICLISGQTFAVAVMFIVYTIIEYHQSLTISTTFFEDSSSQCKTQILIPNMRFLCFFFLEHCHQIYLPSTKSMKRSHRKDYHVAAQSAQLRRVQWRTFRACYTNVHRHWCMLQSAEFVFIV